MATRRNLDQTRQLLLDAGVEELLEHGIEIGLDNVTMIDVCRAAGLSTAGSAYKIWENQDAFRTDVLRHLLYFTTPNRESDENVPAIAATAIAELPQSEEFVRRAGNATLDRWLDGGTARLEYLTLLLAARHDEQLASALRDHDLANLDEHAALYELIAEAFHRSWVAPFDAATLATTLSALIEGLTVRAAYIPDLVEVEVLRPTGPDGELRPWSLYACALEAIIGAFTCPGPLPARVPPTRAPSDLVAVAAEPVTPEPHTESAPVSPERERRRRPLSETRERLLATAAEMLVDSGMDVTVGNVDLVEVSRRAGMSSAGSAYKIWDTKEAYRVDLIRHLLDHTIPGDTTVEEVHEAAAEPVQPSLTEVIRTSARTDMDSNADSRVLDPFLALWLAGHHDPVVAQELAESERKAIALFAELYEFACVAFEREWVPPFDATHLAVLLSALVHGMAIRARSTPERVPEALLRPTGRDGEEQPWHLFACAAEALIGAFTRPTGTSDEPDPPDRPAECSAAQVVQ